ncbi:MAG TPA: sulfatase [Rubrobacter sp.]|nr:sulfatase [Rubrobacter sp.]
MRKLQKRVVALVSFLVLGIISSLGLVVGLGLPAARSEEFSIQSSRRPNIVFVLTDDQMPGTENRMTALQNNVEREGVKFSNTVSTYPLCCPGRAIIQRGQYPHNTKIYGNSLPAGGWAKFRNLGEYQSTIATWLNNSGYQTGLFGKYMNNYRDRLIPPGWDRWYAWNGAKEGWSSVNDQGHVSPLDRHNADVLVAKEAEKFLDARMAKRAPVFAFVNFGAMHSPYFSSKIDDKKFRGVGVPRTPAFNEDDVSDKNIRIRKLSMLSRSQISDLDSQYRRGLRSLQRVDRFIADASGILRRHHEMDNTYFVFYTDNGAHFGQHRLRHGKLQPYEEDINFPLIVRGPGIPHGEVRNGLVGSHDIAPTLADMGNAQTPSFVDGRSVLPLANGTITSWPRTTILSEQELDPDLPPLWGALRMQGQKYIRFANGDKEYYDPGNDPYEVHSNPDSVDQITRSYWEQRLDDLQQCEGSSCRTAENVPVLSSTAKP